MYKKYKQKQMSDEHITIAQTEISKRKFKWRLVFLPFEDVSQIIFLRIIKKYHTYDIDKALFSHWVNRVITNTLHNILRDNYLKYSRPCICGCTFNLGGNHCGFTKSGFQCEECPLYKKWKMTKEGNFNIQQTLSLENHSQEVHSVQSQDLHIESSKQIIDAKMEEKLSTFDFNIYKALFIENQDEKEVVSALKNKGYDIQIRKLKQKFIAQANEIIKQEDLIL